MPHPRGRRTRTRRAWRWLLRALWRALRTGVLLGSAIGPFAPPPPPPPPPPIEDIDVSGKGQRGRKKK